MNILKKIITPNIKKSIYALSMLALSLASEPLWASTLAGTTISNQATVTFSQGSTTGLVLRSNNASFVVNEIIDVQLNWVDSSQIPVSTPDYKKVLTFKITNSGNGTQAYSLSTNPNIGGGNFNPVASNPNIYVENDLQTGLQVTGSNTDTVYSPGSTISLTGGESKNVYLVYDIPANLGINNKGFVQLSAISSAASSVTKAGTTIKNSDGSEAIVGYTLGRGVATGNYIVNNLQVSATKTVLSSKDIYGGTVIESQSTLTYQISLSIQGTGTAKNVTITDALPTQEDYVAGTLLLNNKALPDSGNVVGNNINVVLGDEAAPQTLVLTYQAKIK